jgi:hypothetical protein
VKGTKNQKTKKTLRPNKGTTKTTTKTSARKINKNHHETYKSAALLLLLLLPAACGKKVNNHACLSTSFSGSQSISTSCKVKVQVQQIRKMGGFPWNGDNAKVVATPGSAPNRKKPIKRLKRQKDGNVKPKKTVKMFTKFVEPGAPMRNKRFALREGATVSVRKFFSDPNYQLRLAMATDMFVDNCLPPVKDRSDPRLKKAIKEAKEMYRIHRPNHNG